MVVFLLLVVSSSSLRGTRASWNVVVLWSLVVLSLAGLLVVDVFVVVQSFGGLGFGDCCCSVAFELRVPSLWAPSREGCVRWSRVEARTGGECRRELADHRGTSRVQVTCTVSRDPFGLPGPMS